MGHADCVILCAPAAQCGDRTRHRAGASAGTIVSDVGLVKGAVIAALAPALPAHARLVPAHPVAGTEFSGPDAGFATPVHEPLVHPHAPGGDGPGGHCEDASVLGSARVACRIMSAAHHDLVLAITSHVPHLIAYNLVGAAADLEEVTQSEVIKFSAGGFRDSTRIAASDPTMWRDVFL